MKVTLTAGELETRLIEQINGLNDGEALAELYLAINPDSGIEFNDDEQNFTLDIELKSSNPENRDEVIHAFCQFEDINSWCFGDRYDCAFEHDQFWITHKPSGKQWSVVDAEGENTYDGYGFEVVTDGDEIEEEED